MLVGNDTIYVLFNFVKIATIKFNMFNGIIRIHVDVIHVLDLVPNQNY